MHRPPTHGLSRSPTRDAFQHSRRKEFLLSRSNKFFLKLLRYVVVQMKRRRTTSRDGTSYACWWQVAVGAAYVGDTLQARPLMRARRCSGCRMNGGGRPPVFTHEEGRH
eukprot:CAMPEP_0119471986 /NCGR_PEP_ID=MMETSP1344-20130328/4232_1 /TAXON_ID=236787 /ORGANISM="Florenciella parvula, Strain CCMP2471" /LENGTH=108 /DNA_ID=CAMNT_0007504859 /DNA_START=360 /DNA_END=683 /DNA_ORIENTATION=-